MSRQGSSRTVSLDPDDTSADAPVESALERRLLALEEAIRSRDALLSVVAHDLRNPLNTVALAASLIMEVELTPEKMRRQIELIQRAATTMDRLIQDLLDVSRAESGLLSLELREEETELAAVAPPVAQQLECGARDAGISLVAPGADAATDQVDERQVDE